MPRQWPPETRVQQAFSPNLSLLPMLAVVKAAASLDSATSAYMYASYMSYSDALPPKATTWLAFSLHREIVTQAGFYGMSSQTGIVWFNITALVLVARPTHSGRRTPGLKIGMKGNPY